MEEKHEMDKRIEAAVRSAIEAGITDIEEKIRAAIKVGVEVGAAAAAEAAYATASKIAARERRKLQSQRKDKRYHDIKLLVRKYRQLNAYYENAVYDEESAAEVDEDLEEIMNIFGQKYRDEDRNLTSDSIRRGYHGPRQQNAGGLRGYVPAHAPGGGQAPLEGIARPLSGRGTLHSGADCQPGEDRQAHGLQRYRRLPL